MLYSNRIDEKTKKRSLKTQKLIISVTPKDIHLIRTSNTSKWKVFNYCLGKDEGQQKSLTWLNERAEGKVLVPQFFFKYIDNLSTFKTYKLVFTPLLFNASNFHFSKKLLTFWFCSNDRCRSVRNTRLHIRLRYGQRSIKCSSSLIIQKPLIFFTLFVAKKAKHIILVTNIYKKWSFFQ